MYCISKANIAMHRDAMHCLSRSSAILYYSEGGDHWIIGRLPVGGSIRNMAKLTGLTYG